MVIYAYSVPAILAFILEVGVLIFSLRAERRNFQTRLFVAALFGSMVINIAEISGLQKLLRPEYALILHYAAHIMTLAILAYLAAFVSFNHLPRKLFSTVGVAIYGYALTLVGLLIFSNMLINGVESLGDYTYTRVSGPLFWIYELFVLACIAAITVLPARGLQKDRDMTTRNRCKLWIALSTPLTVLVLVIVILLHFGLRWFNATATTPLLVAVFMAAVGYAVHHHRLIDLNFYFPWSRLKKFKTRLYGQLISFSRAIPHFHTVEQLLERLGVILKCPVVLIGPHTPFHDALENSPLTRFPLPTLLNISRMTVANEIRESTPQLYALMVQYGVAAIVPFFSNSRTVRCWLLLGNPFSRSIYTPQDFRKVEQLFGKMAGLLLDRLVQPDLRLTHTETIQSPKSATTQLKKPLPESVAEFEAGLIRRTLAACNGNQALAARQLGIRANTLHYKIDRYRLSLSSSS